MRAIFCYGNSTAKEQCPVKRKSKTLIHRYAPTAAPWTTSFVYGFGIGITETEFRVQKHEFEKINTSLRSKHCSLQEYNIAFHLHLRNKTCSLP